MRIGAIRNRRSGNANPITLGIIFALIGAALFFLFAFPPLQYASASKSWPTVSGTIIKSEIDIWRNDGKTHYQPDIVYSYKVDNKKYTSSKITVGDPPLDNSITPAKRLQAEYPVDSDVSVWYDPEVPASATLEPGVQRSDYLLAAIAAIFFFAGLIAFYQGLKAKSRAAEAKNETINQ